MASKILRVPRPFTSALYSGTSKETFTWDCAARLYISFGFTFLIKFKIDEASVKSP